MTDKYYQATTEGGIPYRFKHKDKAVVAAKMCLEHGRLLTSYVEDGDKITLFFSELSVTIEPVTPKVVWVYTKPDNERCFFESLTELILAYPYAKEREFADFKGSYCKVVEHF